MNIMNILTDRTLSQSAISKNVHNTSYEHDLAGEVWATSGFYWICWISYLAPTMEYFTTKL